MIVNNISNGKRFINASDAILTQHSTRCKGFQKCNLLT